METKRIIVTGSEGYIGKHVCKMLHQQGHEVYCADKKPCSHTYRVMHRVVDIDDHRWWEEFKAQNNFYDVIIHLAAVASVPAARACPTEAWRTNVMGSLNIMEGAHNLNVTRVVNADSAMSEFGDRLSVYSETKMQAVRVMLRLAQLYDISLVNLRLFNVAGADSKSEFGEDHDPETHFIPLLVDALMLQRGPFRIDTRNPQRDFIHVQDVARAFLIAATESNIGTMTYEVGSSQLYTLKEVAAIAWELYAKKNGWSSWESITEDGKLPSLMKWYEFGATDRPEPPKTMVADPINFVPGWRPIFSIANMIKHQNNFKVAELNNALKLE